MCRTCSRWTGRDTCTTATSTRCSALPFRRDGRKPTHLRDIDGSQHGRLVRSPWPTTVTAAPPARGRAAEAPCPPDRYARDQGYDQKPPAFACRCRRRDRRVLCVRPPALFHPRILQEPASRNQRLLRRAPPQDRHDLLCRLCRGDRAFASGRGDHDAGGGRDLRPAVGHGHRVVRLHARRDACVSRVALPACATGCRAIRRQARGDQRGLSRRTARSTSSRCAWCQRFRSS